MIRKVLVLVLVLGLVLVLDSSSVLAQAQTEKPLQALFTTIGPPPGWATLAGTVADASGETGAPGDVSFETLRDLRRVDLGFAGLRESTGFARKRDEEQPPEEMPPEEEPPKEEPPKEEPPPDPDLDPDPEPDSHPNPNPNPDPPPGSSTPPPTRPPRPR